MSGRTSSRNCIAFAKFIHMAKAERMPEYATKRNTRRATMMSGLTKNAPKIELFGISDLKNYTLKKSTKQDELDRT